MHSAGHKGRIMGAMANKQKRIAVIENANKKELEVIASKYNLNYFLIKDSLDHSQVGQ